MAASTTTVPDLVKLSCIAQNYAWGKPASTSKVAQLLSKQNDNDNCYAELWMGTHKKGPSSVILNNNTTQLVSEYINDELPYLFKVLSIARSLSIQAHPNKDLAKKLHTSRPDVYKDDNHKPEMAIALTPFEAMCGFRPVNEIIHFLKNIPEFNAIVTKDIADKYISNNGTPDDLKSVFSSVMKADKNEVKKQVDLLINRLNNNQKIAPFAVDDQKNNDNDNFVRDIDINELIIRLNNEFPGDVGIFAAFMLNCFRLKAGEAIFLEANLPHAYLDGDCLECMACSDNVVRAGLTPKLRDTPVLCEMLNYNSSKPSIMNGDKIGKYSLQYRVSNIINEFRLDGTIINTNDKECLDLSKINGSSSKYHSIILVYEGKGNINGMDIKQGDCLLLSPTVNILNIENKDNTQSLKLARCYAPS